jgi:hypothetical protein
MFELYMFRGKGDPVEHLAPKHRGILAEPNPTLRKRIKRSCLGRSASIELSARAAQARPGCINFQYVVQGSREHATDHGRELGRVARSPLGSIGAIGGSADGLASVYFVYLFSLASQ